MRTCDRSVRWSCAAAVALFVGSAHAQEIELKNDSLVDGGTAAIQLGFVNGEVGCASFVVPAEYFPLQLKRVQFFWTSQAGDAGPSIQDSIRIYDSGLPEPNLVFLSDPPQLIDGFLNEFDFSFFDIIFEEPTVITIGLAFSDAPNGDVNKPSLVTDIDGCQWGLNPIFAIPGGWQDTCQYGVSGDWVIRAIVEPLESQCRADFNQDGNVNTMDFISFLNAYNLGDPSADFNDDGVINTLDFLAFLNAYNEGCP